MADRYNTPKQGTTDWHIPLNENFNALDRDVEIRDAEANLGNYPARNGSKFFATDTGRCYIGDGQSWYPAPHSPPAIPSDLTTSAEGLLWYNTEDSTLRMTTPDGPVGIVSGGKPIRNEGRGLLGLPTHYVGYPSGLSNEEVARFTLGSDEVLQVWILELQVKGGGSDADVRLAIRDESDGSELASVEAGSRADSEASPLGTSKAGASITIRLSTGSEAIDVCPSGSAIIASE